MASEQNFKCSKCDYETNKEGYLRNHVNQKHGKEEPKSKKENVKPELGLCSCGGKFRLFTAREKREVETRGLDYNKVCMTCDELK